MAEHPGPWRTGTKGRQTIYDADPNGDGGQPGRSLGRMDTPELAARVVAAVNELEALKAQVRRLPISRHRAYPGVDTVRLGENRGPVLVRADDFPAVWDLLDPRDLD
jgi:hypothetical protein